MHHGQKNQNIKQKQYCNKVNQDFKKNGPHQKKKKNLKKKRKPNGCRTFASWSHSFGSAGLEVLVPKGKLPPDNTAMVSLSWKLRLSLGHFG